MTSPYGLHRDPRFWKDPELFEPVRFHTDDIDRNAFIPFNIGPRKCMGTRMAYIEGTLTLAAILRRYTIQVRDGWRPRHQIRVSIARWTGPMRVPGTEVVFPPSGKCLNFIGVDRYTLTADWKISHIDTDWDQLYGFLQLAPVGVPMPSLRAMKAISVAARALTPALRFLSRDGNPDGHRRVDPPFPSITSPDDWADGATRVEQALAHFRRKASA